MRLLIADSDQSEVKQALAGVSIPGASVLVAPHYLTEDPSERLWIACGAPAVKMVQSAGWISKSGGVEARRGALYDVQPDGWTHPIKLGVTYNPTVANFDYANFVNFQCDIGLYRRFELTGSLKPKLGTYAYVTDLNGVIDYVNTQYAATGQPVETCLDLETMGLIPFLPDKHILSVALTACEGLSDVVYIPDLTPAQFAKFLTALEWIMTTPKIKMVGANLKYDLLWLRVKWNLILKNWAFDTCNGGSLIEENRANTLNVHTKLYVPELGGYDDEFNRTFDKSKMETVPKPDLLPYAGGDTDAGLRVYRAIRKDLLKDNPAPSGKPSKNSLPSVYINVIHPALTAIHKMEWHGVCVDVEKFHEFGSDLNGRLLETTQKAAMFLPPALIKKHGGLDEFGGAPLSKPTLIAEYLFSPMGLNLQPLQTTEKTGAPSTSEYHLSQFKEHPEAADVIQLYLDYKSVAKMYGTYYEGFLNHLRPDNRWHPSYIIHKQGSGKHNEQDAAGTVTGRGSATNPAFQCVSGETEILTDTGIHTAAEIIDPSGVADNRVIVPGRVNVWTPTGWKPTSHFFRSWRADRLTVTLDCGLALTCTPEHPIMTDRGWVKASELGYDDYCKLPEPITPLPAPNWCPDVVAEALGVIAAKGHLTEAGGFHYLEIPVEYEAVISEAFRTMGTRPVWKFVDTHVLYTIPHEDLWTPDLTCFIAELPVGPDRGFPRPLRGTEAARGFVKGLHAALGDSYGTKHQVCILEPLPVAFAETIQREVMLHLGTPPLLKVAKDGLTARLKWKGAPGVRYAKWLGLHLPEKWQGPEDRTFMAHKKVFMRVKEIDKAAPGYVYDFTVPDGHCFTANSILVHNTVPKHSYWGTRLRDCIVAPDGKLILGCDYSQGELKIAACWANELNMINAYRDGVDLHVLTAGTVNGMSYEEAMNLKAVNFPAYETLRQNGKAGNFGLLYGMLAYGFMHYADAVYGVKMTIEEAETMRDTFFDLYPGLPMWHTRQITEAQINGCVRSPLGRVRWLHHINSHDKKTRKRAQNQAINSPIQGTLGDMMWWAMGLIEGAYEGEITPFGNVHDQGLWYISEDHVERDIDRVKGVMENLPFEQKFGWKPQLVFTVDTEVGSTLSTLQKVKKAA